MSNGDDGETADEAATDSDADETEEPADEAAEEQASEDEESGAPVRDPADRLDDAEAALEDAATEADLDDVEATLDGIEADLPAEPEDDEEEDEAIAEARDRLADLRDDIDAERGPYAEDIVAELETAETTLTDGEWTEDGELDVIPAVEAFLDAAGEQLLDTFEAESDDPADLAAAVAAAREAVAEADLDPDEDDDTIADLLGAAETLTDDLDAAEVWDDLTVREQLTAEGFYDVLESQNRKDFPAEWNAVKLYEKAYKEGDSEAIEPILLAFDKLNSEFMEENILDSLRRIAPPEAYDDLAAMAEKRDRDAIEILGKIGDERIVDTLHEYVDGGDAALRKTTLRALGAIGSDESVQPVANQLADENAEIRSTAARTLGLLGDTRAIDPLADTLADDDADEVRASAAWALNAIGTERASDVAAEYADDRSYIVQTEAEKARETGEQTA
ncbi:HEAT repeat domain-containing protein [Halorientalis litorea]|uniref:HEAT repeat domain-containing protein n=1 Tax=Halorientalis litorea TaxID=2931977 RepID=UPI001FF4C946|nr:HEAT repeat domain-containing protein [Halorientalis litorea]